MSNGSPADLGDSAGIGPVVARERLDERRLAAPVGTDECMDLARADGERHIDERALGGERLGDVVDRERRDGFVGHLAVMPSTRGTDLPSLTVPLSATCSDT